jgi:uncharacterized protein YnzC (UPF0291/DUF896 family)
MEKIEEYMEKTKEELITIHTELHRSLDKLLACYIDSTKKHLTNTTLMEFLQWSHEQTKNPSCFKPLT